MGQACNVPGAKLRAINILSFERSGQGNTVYEFNIQNDGAGYPAVAGVRLYDAGR